MQAPPFPMYLRIVGSALIAAVLVSWAFPELHGIFMRETKEQELSRIQATWVVTALNEATRKALDFQSKALPPIDAALRFVQNATDMASHKPPSYTYSINGTDKPGSWVAIAVANMPIISHSPSQIVALQRVNVPGLLGSYPYATRVTAEWDANTSQWVSAGAERIRKSGPELMAQCMVVRP